MIGTTNRKTIVVPCIVNSWLYVCGDSSVLSGAPSCRRISSASTPPRMKKTKVVTRYMIPIRLWSVVSDPRAPAASARASTRWAVICGTGARPVAVVERRWWRPCGSFGAGSRVWVEA